MQLARNAHRRSPYLFHSKKAVDQMGMQPGTVHRLRKSLSFVTTTVRSG